ncbi:TetR family transcriptional regulator [Nocardioides albertanoniae]|uniref:TetR family transcriptional regulator n=1 Tax=Nocardioides albertanoniae TaxID=1175486 RepID=A0A543A473_9ACTN|nr:TetR/AcrR family transcriptional regulator [Nocardioides albertanoniae]TQL67382.1 TetR family transcriptional regulator [Nocardioides albertanoniae]
MTSGRNKQPSTAERLITAARECVIAVGWRRTTLTDVANRAGVSRMTVYRTYPDMTTLFADLMTQEWLQVVSEVLPADADPRGPEQFATAITGTVSAVRRNELFRRAIDLDPEWLLPYLFVRRGRSQDAVLELLATELARAQQDGSIRSGDPAQLARTIVLAAHGHVLSIATMTDEDISTDSLDRELTELVRRYLTP